MLKQNSKLALGTVQLGLQYGVANTYGKPNHDEALQILNVAYQQGIDLFDTAPLYGDSEKLLGIFIKQLKESDSGIPMISTKLSGLDMEALEYEIDVYHKLRDSLLISLERLAINKAHYCLLHQPRDMVSYKGKILLILQKLKEEGLIEKIGVSIYTPDEADRALMLGFDTIQIPINILDHRLINQGLLKKLKESDIEIHARSIYLQGLLFLNPNELPSFLSQAKKPLEQLHQITNEIGLTISELAILYVREIDEVDKMIIGCETKDQLMQNLRIINMPNLSHEIKNRISELFKNIPEKVLNPTLWR